MTTTSSFIEAQRSIFASSPQTLSSEQRRFSNRFPFDENHHLIAGTSGDSTTTGTIQRKLQELQLSALPVLEKAKYKAEASLSPRRGFIPSAPASSSSGIVSGAGMKAISKGNLRLGRSGGEERDGLLLSDDDNVGQDSGDDDDNNYIAALKGEGCRIEGPQTVLRDQMKWPPGEGWNRL